MPSNSAPREGLVPRQITDKNGKQTTVWIRPEDASAADADVSAALKTKSMNKHSAERSIDADFVTSCDDTAVDQRITALEKNPSLLEKEKYRAMAAEAYVVASVRAEASKRQRDEMKREILRLVTDDEAARGDVVFEDSGERIEVTVAMEKGEFFPERSGMGVTERAECTEQSVDVKQLEKMFPGLSQETGSFDGTLDHEVKDKNGYKRAVKLAHQNIKDKDNDDTDVVTAFANADEQYMTSAQHVERMESVFHRYMTEEEKYPLDHCDGMGPDELQWSASTRMSKNDFSSPKTGTVSVKPTMTCSANAATAAIRGRVTSMAEGHPTYESYSAEKKKSFLNNRTSYFASRAIRMNVSAEKVKALYPEMYERGRPTERVLYIDDI